LRSDRSTINAAPFVAGVRMAAYSQPEKGSSQLTMRYRPILRGDLPALGRRYGISSEHLSDAQVVSAVLPFRMNEYVADLVDWSHAPDDPMFRMVFPQRDMLHPSHFERMKRAIQEGHEEESAFAIRNALNPQPDNQADYIPTLDSYALRGLQHKYRESILVFPSVAQTCHAYCAFCFRFAQFVDTGAIQFSLTDPDMLASYLAAHPEITDVIYTGGDPLVASTPVLERFLMPAMRASHVTSIRIGTKSLAYWPHRFVDDVDADDLLRVFDSIRASGKGISIMAHVSHSRELETDITRRAIERLGNAGVSIRTQTPILRQVNDSADALTRLWSRQVQLNCVPYYLFMPRDTGAHAYFDVPLARAIDVITDARRKLSGLAGSARGPVMSTIRGKVEALGTIEIGNTKSFVLRLLRAVDPSVSGKLFLADFDPEVSSFSGLTICRAESKQITLQLS
jgi:KamA family protein